MRVLITGINSVLGVKLSNQLLMQNHEICGLYNTAKNRIPSSISAFPYYSFDYSGFKPELVFVLGAYVPRGNYNTPDTRFNELNITPVRTLIQHYPNARFILASSVSVYGDAKGILTEDSTPLQPTLYGQSKLEAEKLLHESNSWASVRFSSIYGPNLNDTTFINRAISQARMNQEIVLFGDGLREQNYIYLDDAVQFLIAAAHFSKNRVFLGTSTHSVSNKHVAEIIRDFLPGTKITYTQQDNSPSYHYNNSSSLKMLNFKPEISLEKGIENVLKG